MGTGAGMANDMDTGADTGTGADTVTSTSTGTGMNTGEGMATDSDTGMDEGREAVVLQCDAGSGDYVNRSTPHSRFSHQGPSSIGARVKVRVRAWALKGVQVGLRSESGPGH